MPRTQQFGRWVWGHLHRENESYWWLAPVLLGWLGLFAAAMGLLAHLIDSSRQPLIVLAAFAHQLMWGIVLALVVFVVARRWWALFFALVLFSGVASTQAGLYISAGKATPGPRLVILQANLRLGSANPDSIVDLVRARHVDIATTEELTDDEQTNLIHAGMSQQLPYHYLVSAPSGATGLGIWSRYPLTATVNHPGYILGVLSATVVVPGRPPFTVVAAHIKAPYPYPPRRWVAEMVKLKRLLAEVGTGHRSVLVGGDFNGTPDNAQFRQLLSNGYADTAQEVGAGYLPTYPADEWYPPMLAIDHVLTANIAPVSVSSVKLPGSDHRGLIATVAV